MPGEVLQSIGRSIREGSQTAASTILAVDERNKKQAVADARAKLFAAMMGMQLPSAQVAPDSTGIADPNALPGLGQLADFGQAPAAAPADPMEGLNTALQEYLAIAGPEGAAIGANVTNFIEGRRVERKKDVRQQRRDETLAGFGDLIREGTPGAFRGAGASAFEGGEPEIGLKFIAVAQRLEESRARAATLAAQASTRTGKQDSKEAEVRSELEFRRNVLPGLLSVIWSDEASAEQKRLAQGDLVAHWKQFYDSRPPAYLAEPGGGRDPKQMTVQDFVMKDMQGDLTKFLTDWNRTAALLGNENMTEDEAFKAVGRIRLTIWESTLNRAAPADLRERFYGADAEPFVPLAQDGSSDTSTQSTSPGRPLAGAEEVDTETQVQRILQKPGERTPGKAPAASEAGTTKRTSLSDRIRQGGALSDSTSATPVTLSTVEFEDQFTDSGMKDRARGLREFLGARGITDRARAIEELSRVKDRATGDQKAVIEAVLTALGGS